MAFRTVNRQVLDLDSQPIAGPSGTQHIAGDFITDMDTSTGWDPDQLSGVQKDGWVRLASTVDGGEDNRVKIVSNPIPLEGVGNQSLAHHVADAPNLEPHLLDSFQHSRHLGTHLPCIELRLDKEG